MSWQATKWALDQNVGHSGRKLLLLAIANYADKHGYCWPSQETLGKKAEMSLDTVQRQTKRLIAQGLISVSRAPKRRGQWQTFRYQLNLSGQSAQHPHSKERGRGYQADTPPVQADTPLHQRNNCGLAEPQLARQPGRTAMRLKPSIEPPLEPSAATADAHAPNNSVSGNPYAGSLKQPISKTPTAAAERLLAFQGRQEPIEVTQNRIARKLGSEGWLILSNMSSIDLERLTTLERQRRLDEDTLMQAVLRARLANRREF